MERLHSLLVRLDGPESRSREDRDAAVAELRSMGPVVLRAAIEPLLAASDPEMKCQAGTAAMMAEAEGWQDLVLSLLEDPEGVVRWHACGGTDQRNGVSFDQHDGSASVARLGAMGSARTPASLGTR